MKRNTACSETTLAPAVALVIVCDTLKITVILR